MSYDFEAAPEALPIVDAYQVFASKTMTAADDLEKGKIRRVILWGANYPDMHRILSIEGDHPDVVLCSGATVLKKLIATNDELHGHSNFNTNR